MKAGRELDVLIAEKVMGHKVWFNKSGIDGQEYPMIPGKFAYDHVPFYSHNIADAWSVVEKFKSEDYLFSLKNIVKGTFTFSLTDWGGNCSTYAAEAKTAPLAICLAALKAVGVDVE